MDFAVDKRKVSLIVIGMAGSGKTTFVSVRNPINNQETLPTVIASKDWGGMCDELRSCSHIFALHSKRGHPQKGGL